MTEANKAEIIDVLKNMKTQLLTIRAKNETLLKSLNSEKHETKK